MKYKHSFGGEELMTEKQNGRRISVNNCNFDENERNFGISCCFRVGAYE
jgi:hypothetical protein